jgi:hypothetical protein
VSSPRNLSLPQYRRNSIRRLAWEDEKAFSGFRTILSNVRVTQKLVDCSKNGTMISDFPAYRVRGFPDRLLCWGCLLRVLRPACSKQHKGELLYASTRISSQWPVYRIFKVFDFHGQPDELSSRHSPTVHGTRYSRNEQGVQSGKLRRRTQPSSTTEFGESVGRSCRRPRREEKALGPKIGLSCSPNGWRTDINPKKGSGGYLCRAGWIRVPN